MQEVKQGDTAIGSEVKVKVVKNKVAPPFRHAEFELMHDHGISREGDLINLAVEDKVIDKSGAWLQLRRDPAWVRAARRRPRTICAKTPPWWKRSPARCWKSAA